MQVVIRVRGLELSTSIGVAEAERAIPRRLRFDLTLHLSEAPGACRTDEVEDTVDYGTVIQAVETTTQARSHKTLENLASEVGHVLLAGFPAIGSLEVSVAKPLPPVPQIVTETSVEISLHRRDTMECNARDPR